MMKTVLSYCSARAFSAGLLPMVSMSHPQPAVTVNDNDARPEVKLSINPPEHQESAGPLHRDRAVYRQVAYLTAALVLLAAIVTLPLLQGLVIPGMTTSVGGPEIIRGSPIAPVLLQPQRSG
jgi:hypothetical protein